MRLFHHISAITVMTVMLIGCGGRGKEAKSPSTETQADYNWADYKGTYAPGSPATKGQSETPPAPSEAKAGTDAKPETSASSDAKDKPEKTEKTASADSDGALGSDDPPPTTKKKKKKKKGGVAGGSKPPSPSAGTPKKAPRKRAKR
jgi:hypothetical protein